MLTGTFTPRAEAKTLSKAVHLNRSSTPVTVRFSNSTGIPMLPDNSPDANSRGMAIRFKISVQVAGEGDVVDDATVHWPADRPLMELGTVELTELVEDNAKEQQHIIYDPIPRTEGIEPTADPLFELRAAIYLISGRRRRAAAAAS